MRGFDGCQVTIDERQSPDPPANAHAGNEGLACGAHMRVVCEAGVKRMKRRIGEMGGGRRWGGKGAGGGWLATRHSTPITTALHLLEFS